MTSPRGLPTSASRRKNYSNEIGHQPPRLSRSKNAQLTCEPKSATSTGKGSYTVTDLTPAKAMFLAVSQKGRFRENQESIYQSTIKEYIGRTNLYSQSFHSDDQYV